MKTPVKTSCKLAYTAMLLTYQGAERDSLIGCWEILGPSRSSRLVAQSRTVQSTWTCWQLHQQQNKVHKEITRTTDTPTG